MMVVHTYVCTYVVIAWVVGFCQNCMSDHMTTYSDAVVVEVTAHLGVLQLLSLTLAPPHVMDIKLVINVVNNHFNGFVCHCTCQGKPYGIFQMNI